MIYAVCNVRRVTCARDLPHLFHSKVLPATKCDAAVIADGDDGDADVETETHEIEPQYRHDVKRLLHVLVPRL